LKAVLLLILDEQLWQLVCEDRSLSLDALLCAVDVVK